MKSHLSISLRLTFVTLVLFGVVYPVLISGISWITNGGEGDLDLIGQSFSSDKYFNGRPSAVNYNAAATGGSNKGPSNPEYLKQVEARIEEFLVKNPSVERIDVPVDLVTASGSGIDPHISVKGAYVQVGRIAAIRGVSADAIRNLVQENTERPLFGVFGPERVNVLKLNIALDQLK